MSTKLVPLAVKVWGPWACFTRPEMKVERVSYPVPTASAARGILEAIFWKPEFSWDVRDVWVLNPIRYGSIMRNEVKSKIAVKTARGWAQNGEGGYVASSDRTQRHTLALQDVAYIIRAQVVINPRCSEDPTKFRAQFRRRVARGQCFTRPYFGCREFAASFCEPDGDESPIDVTHALGRMLLDLDYDPNPKRQGRGQPRFHDAHLARGILRYPSRFGEEA